VVVQYGDRNAEPGNVAAAMVGALVADDNQAEGPGFFAVFHVERSAFLSRGRPREFPRRRGNSLCAQGGSCGTRGVYRKSAARVVGPLVRPRPVPFGRYLRFRGDARISVRLCRGRIGPFWRRSEGPSSQGRLPVLGPALAELIAFPRRRRNWCQLIDVVVGSRAGWCVGCAGRGRDRRRTTGAGWPCRPQRCPTPLLSTDVSAYRSRFRGNADRNGRRMRAGLRRTMIAPAGCVARLAGLGRMRVESSAGGGGRARGHAG
jgi:hypothetical protein